MKDSDRRIPRTSRVSYHHDLHLRSDLFCLHSGPHRPVCRHSGHHHSGHRPSCLCPRSGHPRSDHRHGGHHSGLRRSRGHRDGRTCGIKRILGLNSSLRAREKRTCLYHPACHSPRGPCPHSGRRPACRTRPCRPSGRWQNASGCGRSRRSRRRRRNDCCCRGDRLKKIKIDSIDSFEEDRSDLTLTPVTISPLISSPGISVLAGLRRRTRPPVAHSAVLFALTGLVPEIKRVKMQEDRRTRQ